MFSTKGRVYSMEKECGGFFSLVTSALSSEALHTVAPKIKCSFGICPTGEQRNAMELKQVVDDLL